MTLLLLLTHAMVDNVLFLVQIFEMVILMDLHVLKPSETVNHTFKGWSVCLCVPVLA